MTDAKTEVTRVEPVVEEEPEEFDAAYYGIRVNGKIVWQSKGEPMLVDKVTINNARGEVTVIGSHNNDSWLDITVNERSYEAPIEYLDMVEAEKAQERRDRYEPDPSIIPEGYVAADPETGKPVDSDNPQTDISEEKASESSSVEF